MNRTATPPSQLHQPGAAGNSEVEQLKAKIAEMEKEVEQLKKDGTVKEQTITEISNSKAVLQQRLNEIEALQHDAGATPGGNPQGGGGGSQHVDPGVQGKIKNILDTVSMGGDTTQAGNDLAQLIQDGNNQATQKAVNAALASVTHYNQMNDYIKKVKDDNPELLPFEAFISARAGELMTGNNPLSLQDALNKAVSEAKESIKTVKTTAEPPELPPGADAEQRGGGEGTQGPTPPVEEPTQDQNNQNFVDTRRDQQQNKVL